MTSMSLHIVRTQGIRLCPGCDVVSDGYCERCLEEKKGTLVPLGELFHFDLYKVCKVAFALSLVGSFLTLLIGGGK